MPVATRRNGKQQACEPCRRRKVGCDHVYPVCSRCAKRGGKAACVYAIQDSGWKSSRASKTSRPSGGEHSKKNESGSVQRLSSAGYLGPTSFSAVLQETRSSLDRLPNYDASNVVATRISKETAAHGRLSEYQMQRAVAVLQQIPSRETALDLFSRHISPIDGWIRITGVKLIETTWEAFRSYLSEATQIPKLREMAELISRNTNRPLLDDEKCNDPRVWFDTFSGQNLRWESLAVIFAYLASGAVAGSSPGDQSRNLLLAYKECCSSCISCANSASNANTLMLYALYKLSILEASIHGDASLAYWKRHAETVAMLTFLGIHVKTNPANAPYQPTILSEVLRGLFCQIFIMDKVTATFAGRPPLLAWKYCTTLVPLDLDDDVLLSNTACSEQQIQSMASGESNPNLRVRASTILRARTSIAIVREEILEVALGCTGSHSIDYIMGLKTQELDIYSLLPHHVICHIHEDLKQLNPPLLFAKILIRLEHLLNLFFIERLLAVKPGVCNIDLLSISFEMLSLTLVLWTQKDRLSGFQGEFEWLVIGHGAPAAGILCNELITSNPLLSKGQRATVAGMSLSRSTIIQQLSLLIGFLDWVGPAQPNSDLAITVKAIIQHVLDQALNYSSVISTPDFDLNTNMDDFYNFDLLDTFDWLRSETNPEQQFSNLGM